MDASSVHGQPSRVATLNGSFVNRKEEIGAVTQLVADTYRQITGSFPEEFLLRTIVFSGARGTGKSALALRLRESFAADDTVRTFFIRLGRREGDYPADMHAAKDAWIWNPTVDDLRKTIAATDGAIADKLDEHALRMHHLLTRMGDWLPSDAIRTARNRTLDELSNWLARDIDRAFDKKQVLLVLVDGVHEADDAFNRLLEKHLLGPIQPLAPVVLVLTGRGEPFGWSSPFLRPEPKKIDPLNEEDVEELVKSLGLPVSADRVRSLLELGGGYPLNIKTLATYPSGPVAALPPLVEELFSGLRDRESLQMACEVVCPLEEGFNRELLAMLQAHQPDKAWRETAAEESKDALVRQRLIQWDAGTYRLDEAIAIPLRAYLRQHKPKLWQQLNCAAQALYEDWANEYPGQATRYRAFAEQHQKECQEQLGHH